MLYNKLEYGRKEEMKLNAKAVIKSVIAVVLALLMLWLFAIPVSLHSPLFVVLCGFAIIGVSFAIVVRREEDYGDSSGGKKILALWSCIVAVIAIALLVSSPIVSSHAHASRMDVKQSSFEEWSDRLLIDGISLMDTESAARVGNRELGSLSDVVSQFDDAAYYQIVLDGKPAKVAPLQYVSVWSWLQNRGNGTPGYVVVDPIKQEAEYHELGDGKGMKFVPSAFLGEKLARHLWFQFPFDVLGDSHFELDDEGKPYYVTPVLSFRAGLFGAEDVSAVIVTDPADGSSERYDLGSVPAWVDVVYSGDMLDSMYDSYGAYSGGFLNSLFSKVGCTKTGGDYGYATIDGEQWIYTGVTSMNGDSSNVGFLLASERTKESFFIPMPSADEASAMSSAEGKVQQFGYSASFPSLVSIDGQPTYAMVLKDAAGLIRLYAMVNAESYNVVACEENLISCKEAYERAMGSAGIRYDKDSVDMPDVDTSEDSGSEVPEASAFDTEVESSAIVTEGGEAFLYVLGADGKVYRKPFADDRAQALSIKEGDAWSGEAYEADGFLVVAGSDASGADGAAGGTAAGDAGGASDAGR